MSLSDEITTNTVTLDQNFPKPSDVNDMIHELRLPIISDKTLIDSNEILQRLQSVLI